MCKNQVIRFMLQIYSTDLRYVTSHSFAKGRSLLDKDLDGK